ncbi:MULTISPECIES: alpha/beta hydrolase [unclassified Ketobacter]|uniref:alpha/beta hydrolase n=1 Tax=unclassified Ketobacter TaxID=2639109 RepID=UPI0025BDD14B|nr:MULTISPECIES: alpha/beta hydrolase [unclassified Ketobacter]
MKRNTIKQLVSLVLPLLVLSGCGGGSECYYDAEPSGGISSARVFYPCDLPDNSQSYRATTLSGGFTNNQQNMYWLAQYLVEQGNMVVFTVSAVDNLSVPGYESAQRSGYDLMQTANMDPANPLYLRLGKYALMGYSMGGGAVLNVGNELADAIDAIVALAPYSPNENLANVTADTLLLVGQNDIVAPPGFSAGAYDNLPAGISKAYMQLANFDHLKWMNNTGSSNNSKAARQVILDWFDYALSGSGSAQQALLNPPQEIITNQNNL